MAAEPTRIVADAGVLVADLFVDGPARETLDHVRSHSWLTLVASDSLLDDAEVAIARLADDGLAADWRGRIDDEREAVDHPDEDHPALASAYRGEAAHLVSFDESLTTAKAGLSIQPHASLSIRTPDAFVSVFDAASLYETKYGDPYPGPDRDPRD